MIIKILIIIINIIIIIITIILEIRTSRDLLRQTPFRHVLLIKYFKHLTIMHNVRIINAFNNNSLYVCIYIYIYIYILYNI